MTAGTLDSPSRLSLHGQEAEAAQAAISDQGVRQLNETSPLRCNAEGERTGLESMKAPCNRALLQQVARQQHAQTRTTHESLSGAGACADKHCFPTLWMQASAAGQGALATAGC